jgi:replicative DNA helicase Mcm
MSIKNKGYTPLLGEGSEGLMQVSPQKWEKFLRRYYEEEILRLSSIYPEQKSLYIDFSEILKYDPSLGDALVEDPDFCLSLAQEGLKEISGIGLNLRVLNNPRVIGIKNLRSIHLSKFISVEGIIRRVQEVRPRLVEGAFECQKCKHVTRLHQNGVRFREPPSCENETCGRGAFKLLIDESKFIDSQRITLEESPETLRGGEQPQRLTINVEEDLAGLVAPGDRVKINGILRSYQKIGQLGKLTTFDIYLEAISIEMKDQAFEEEKISSEDEEEIRKLSRDEEIYEKIVSSIAPSIYGYRKIKEAIALQLFSGVPKLLPDGSRIRGDIHVLLVGDPGTAKSMLLQYVTKLAPRGIYTSGRGSTAAGLTASATRDEEGRWVLEAGALVMADNGIAAVDEIDKMRSEDRSALHEALEQQTVSIAKAGITATLKSRCALLGAANPKHGRFSLPAYESIANQVDLPPGLLTRFDLIFQLSDRPDEENDSRLAEHILSSHHAGELAASLLFEESRREMERINPEIPPELLRKYIAYAKKNVFPVMSRDALEKFKEFYVELRRLGEEPNSPMPVTARQLEALVRLGEASARVRLGGEITSEDAERVISLLKESLMQVAFDHETGKFDIDMVSSGISKSQRDKIRMILDIIRELGGEKEVAEEDVLGEAVERGIEKEKAMEILQKLESRGEIYKPRTGKIRLSYVI